MIIVPGYDEHLDAPDGLSAGHLHQDWEQLHMAHHTGEIPTLSSGTLGLPITRSYYEIYNSHTFNGFNNCTLWSIIVVITLGKCAHQTPADVLERHTCILASWKVKMLYENSIFTVEPQQRWTCVSWMPRKRIYSITQEPLDTPDGLLTGHPQLERYVSSMWNIIQEEKFHGPPVCSHFIVLYLLYYSMRTSLVKGIVSQD
jgi:hypothetical protein